MDEQTQGNSVNSTTSGKNGIVRALVALVLFVVYYYVMTMVGSLVAEATKLSPMYAIYGVRCAFALVAFVALGGRRYLRLDLQAIRNSVRLAWPIIALNLVLCLGVFGFRAYQQFAGVAEKPFDLTSFLGNAALLLALCAMVGIDEELGLRGLAFGGLLACLGKKRWGIMLAAVLSSLLFGYLHVAADLSKVATTPQALQAAMKTLQSAQFGFILCAAVLTTHNIVGAMITHCLGDWLLYVCTVALSGSSVGGTSYVSSEASTSYVVIAVFAVQCLILLPATVKAFKKLRRLEPPQLGPFMES